MKNDGPPLDRTTWNQAESDALQARWAYVRAAKDRLVAILAESRKPVPDYTRFDSALLDVTLGRTGQVPLFYSLSMTRTLEKSDTESPNALGASVASATVPAVAGVRAATLLTSIGLPQKKLLPRNVDERIPGAWGIGARICRVSLTTTTSFTAGDLYYGILRGYYNNANKLTQAIADEGYHEIANITYTEKNTRQTSLGSVISGNFFMSGQLRYQYSVVWDMNKEWPTLVDEDNEILTSAPLARSYGDQKVRTADAVLATMLEGTKIRGVTKF